MNNSKYFNENCFDILPTIPDSSVDLIFCDLPYNSTNCKWDQSVIDLDKLWIEFKRIRKDTTPIVMTCTTKFGWELIKSNPKEFRFDMVWQKSRKCGFLQARKRPLCNHEMVYFFYKKQPKYNYLRYHTYSKKESSKIALTGDCYNQSGRKTPLDKGYGTYEPTLPASVIVGMNTGGKGIYKRLVNKNGEPQFKDIVPRVYDPPLPASVIVNDNEEKARPIAVYGDGILVNDNYSENSKVGVLYGVSGRKTPLRRSKDLMIYDPPLPASVIVNDNEEKSRPIAVYGDGIKSSQCGTYEPSLPASVIVNNDDPRKSKEMYNVGDNFKENNRGTYEPTLPASIQPFKSTKPSKHQTGKPLDLMEFILKYWTDEGDTVFDPTFGGGSMPIQCKKMNRNFIGCEMDKKFYDDAIKLIDKN